MQFKPVKKGSGSMTEWLKKSSFFIVIGLFIVLFLFFTRDRDNPPKDDLTPLTTNYENEAEAGDFNEEGVSEEVIVDIKGEISQPGVYELTPDARVKDVVELASGFTKDADETSINLAQKVHDEMIIIVPSESEADSAGNVLGESSNSEQDKIRINYATQEEIESLSGIGPSKAEAIIQYREEHGMFQSVEDLLEISGIGEKTLENFRDNIQIP